MKIEYEFQEYGHKEVRISKEGISIVSKETIPPEDIVIPFDTEIIEAVIGEYGYIWGVGHITILEIDSDEKKYL